MSVLTESKGKYLFILPWTLEFDGGVNQVVENLIFQMKIHSEYQPIVLVNSWNDTSFRKEKIRENSHYFFRLRSLYDSNKKFRNLIAYITFFPITMVKFFKFLNFENIAIINFHFCSLSALNVTFLKMIGMFNGKLILSFHGADILAAKHTKGLEKILYKLLLNSADLITTCSEQLKEEVISINSRCCGNVKCIYNGVDLKLFDKMRQKNVEIESKFNHRNYILNVATYEYKKGQDVLIRAFSKISILFPNTDLVMIGRPAEASDALKVLIASLDLGKRVWIYENMPHYKVLAFFEKATVFALTSRREPFGIVILEAGLFRLPVVATKVGGIPEILKHDQTGLLYDPDDVEGLASNLAYLLKYPEERFRLGSNLKKHVENNFSWEQAYLKYIESIF